MIDSVRVHRDFVHPSSSFLLRFFVLFLVMLSANYLMKCLGTPWRWVRCPIFVISVWTGTWEWIWCLTELIKQCPQQGSTDAIGCWTRGGSDVKLLIHYSKTLPCVVDVVKLNKCAESGTYWCSAEVEIRTHRRLMAFITTTGWIDGYIFRERQRERDTRTHTSTN